MIKINDFVEIDFDGIVKATGDIFDTTNDKTAEELGFKRDQPGPVILCVGQGQAVAGLDNALIGKSVPSEFTVTLEPELAFGKKDASQIKMVNTAMFKKERITPQPGMHVVVDDLNGIVKSVSGSRTIIDFNHALSGKVVEYHVKINRLIEDLKTQLRSFVSVTLHVPIEMVQVEEKEGNVEISLPLTLPEPLQKFMTERIKDVLKDLKNITFKSTQKV